MKDLIMQFLNNRLVKIYDDMKQKNAKMALFISLVVFALGSLANELLSQATIMALLPTYIVGLLKVIVTLASFVKIALTGARTTEQLKQLQTEATFPEEPTPATESEEVINKTLSKKIVGPAPQKGSIEDTIK